MNEMKEYVEEIEAKLNKSETSNFHKYRFYKMAEAHKELMEKESKICPDKYSLVFMIDDENAIVESHKPIEHNGLKYPYSAVIGGRCLNHMFETIDEALLYYVGVKHEGDNSRFAEYAWRMLDKEDK